MTDGELLLKALQDKNSNDVRLTHGDRWLYWENEGVGIDHWVVRGKLPNGRYSVLFYGLYLQSALDKLLED